MTTTQREGDLQQPPGLGSQRSTGSQPWGLKVFSSKSLQKTSLCTSLGPKYCLVVLMTALLLISTAALFSSDLSSASRSYYMVSNGSSFLQVNLQASSLRCESSDIMAPYLQACSTLGDPALQNRCGQALLRLAEVKDRVGRQLANDLHMWPRTTLDLPWGVRERIAKEALVYRGTGSDDALKEQIVAALLGEPTGIVTLGGSNTAGAFLEETYGRGGDKNEGSYSYYLGLWWNATFPHKKNYCQNSGIAATNGAAPLLCLEKFLGLYPSIVTLEFNVNPTGKEDAIRLMNLLGQQTRQKSHLAILNLELPQCIRWPTPPCLDNIGIAESTSNLWPWAANWTDISIGRNISTFSISRGFAPYWNSSRHYVPEFYKATSPLDVFTYERSGLVYGSHINHRGHELVALPLVRHIIDIIIGLTKEELVDTMLLERFQGDHLQDQPMLSDSSDVASPVCFATDWSFLQQIRTAPLNTILVAATGWAREDLVSWETKAMFSAYTAGATATFRLNVTRLGVLIVAYYQSVTYGEVALKMIDAEGQESSLRINSGEHPVVDGVRMVALHIVENTILPLGTLTCTFEILEGDKIGFGIVGLFVAQL